MSMRDRMKGALQRNGLFPAARAAYRDFSPHVRFQRHREEAFYRPLLKPDALCFDIGANLGQKAEVFLACEARVVIVEPNILCHPTLQHLFGSEPRATIVAAALGSAPGFIDLHVHGTDSTASTRPDWDSQVFNAKRSMASLVVPAMTLDAMIARFGRPDFIKIDVEGFEFEVLKGLSSRVPLVSLEYFANEMGRMRDCLSLLKYFGDLTVRPSDMACTWLGERTADVERCLVALERDRAQGDLFVWVS